MDNSQTEITTEQIWRELSDRLRQFIISRVHSKVDAEDILQTVFMRIHEKLDSLHQVERLESWVFQITRNAITDFFRKAVKSNKMTIEAEATDLSARNCEEDQNLNTDVANCLGTLIAHLPDEQKRALTMYELENISQKEVADRESISLSGAKSRIQRGRRKLEDMIRDCCNLEMDRRGNIIECKNDDCSC